MQFSRRAIRRHLTAALAFRFLLLLVILPPMPLLALGPGGVWRADWITSSSGPQRDNAVYYFRKSLTLKTVPKSFLVDVSADNKFILYVNGSHAGDGPATSDLAHWKYERLDLAPLLHAGTNVIAAVVWNFGVASPVYQISARTGFLMRAENPAEKAIDTGPTWEVERDLGRRAIEKDYKKLLKAYYGAVPGEMLDGRRQDWNWKAASDPSDTASKPGVQDNARWELARVIGPARPWGAISASTEWVLQPDPLPPMEYKPIAAGRVRRSSGVQIPQPGKLSFAIPAHTQASILIDAGVMTTGYPEITMSGGKNARVRVTYAEALVDKEGNRENRNRVEGMHIVGIWDEFIADGGTRHTFSPLNWRAWRYMQLDITTDAQPLEIENVSVIFSAFPFKKRASFVSSDPELNKIWEVGWRTARLDAHETYMDTPYWERLQYVADTRIQALISYAVAGDDRLARQAIDAIDDSRLPGGITQSRYPSRQEQVIPPFSLLWIDMLHDYWMYRGNPHFVRSHLVGSRAVLDWFLRHQQSNGMIGRMPWWNFVDWAAAFPSGVPPQDQNGDSAPITLQFIGALRNGADLEKHLGEAGKAAKYEAAARRASDAVWKLCWNSQRGLVADTPAQNSFSQQTNVLAVWLGVVPSNLQQAVMRKILSPPAGETPPLIPVSYYFRFYLSRAIESSGLGNQYLATLGPWRHMLSMGLTTWAERRQRPRSDSHAWSAHPTYDLLRIVAGIRPGSPGFASIVVDPHLGNLSSLKASQPTPKGMVEVSYRKSTQGIEARIEIPKGTPAKLLWKTKTYPLHAGIQEMVLP